MNIVDIVLAFSLCAGIVALLIHFHILSVNQAAIKSLETRVTALEKQVANDIGSVKNVIGKL